MVMLTMAMKDGGCKTDLLFPINPGLFWFMLQLYPTKKRGVLDIKGVLRSHMLHMRMTAHPCGTTAYQGKDHIEAITIARPQKVKR
jgi:hypothetical protein